MSERALDERLGRHAAIFCEQLLFKRAAVHADADGDFVRPAGIHDRLDAVLSPDVAGVDANFVRAARRRFHGKAIVEVDVRDKRDRDILPDLAQRVRGLHGRHRDAHDLAARRLERMDLRDGGLCVLGVRVAHRLDGDWCAAADGDAARDNLLAHNLSSLQELDDIMERDEQHQRH